MKEAIIYDSLSGNTESLAQTIKEQKKDIIYEKIKETTKETIKDINIL